MKLIAIDMDGTLLSKDDTISQANREAIYEAQNQGNRIAICSGRSILDIKEIMLRDNIVASIIGGNGSTIYHLETLKQLSLSPELLHELIEIVETENLYYEIYTNDGILVKESSKEILEMERNQLLEKSPHLNPDELDSKIHTQLTQHHMHIVPNFEVKDVASQSPYKICVFSFFDEKRARLQERIADRNDIMTTSGMPEVIEIGHKDASKAYGLTYLANHFNIPIENTIAIGDNLNDISMFEIAGISIAMENAREEAKKAAKYMTKSRDEDGVAHALKKFVLNPELVLSQK